MKRLLSAAVLLLACAHAPGAGAGICRTRCGESATEGDCESLQRYEARAIRLLSLRVFEFREERICKALNGWKIEIHHHDPLLDKSCPERGWELFKGFCAGGFTHADTKVIEIGTSNWAESPLVHEMAHVADYDLTGRVGHCRWSDPGLLSVMQEMIGETEITRPGPECDGGTPSPPSRFK